MLYKMDKIGALSSYPLVCTGITIFGTSTNMATFSKVCISSAINTNKEVHMVHVPHNIIITHGSWVLFWALPALDFGNTAVQREDPTSKG